LSFAAFYTFNLNMMIKSINLNKFFVQVSYVVIFGVAAYHKIIGDFPPDWFVNKFQNTFLGFFDFGVSLSFLIITALEILIPLIIFLAIIRGESFVSCENHRYSVLALDLSIFLFLILLFGSFLVQDYQNGFFDFMYLFATLVLKKFFFQKTIQD
jgi:hypothetical protein